MTTVLLAHGSPDPRHAGTLENLRARVASSVRAGGGGMAQLAYIEHDTPCPRRLGVGLRGEVTLVPMLITPAFHARVDVPAAAHALAKGGARVRIATPLGGHPLLLEAAAQRLRAAGHPAAAPVLLVAGGSSSGEVGRGLAELLARHPRPGWTSTTLAAPAPGAAEGRVVVPLTLAEGVLHDKVAAFAAAAGSPFVAGSLADTTALAELVTLRASG